MPLEFSSPCTPNTVSYTIRSGDSINKIAGLFNISPNSILKSNPEIHPLNLKVGQSICIPFDLTSIKPCPIGSIPYKIQAGETLGKIAQKFSTTLESLLLANPGIRPKQLSVGQVICISQSPPVKPLCPTLNFYVIRSGDIPKNIASAFDISLSDLLNANPEIQSDSLVEGQILCIPLAPTTVSLTVSLNQKILTLYKEGIFITAYPVSAGKPSTPTPVGTFTVINKQVNPGGPYGTRWMGLSEKSYGIHGTNQPMSIGFPASNGCVRMYNEDVEELFNLVPVKAVVRIF